MLQDFFKGTFAATTDAIAQKLQGIKAFVFDWDGVFNPGFKDSDASSPFSEIDAMGTNLLRFNHYLRNEQSAPVTAIITGEKNKAALAFAEREHVSAIYCGIKYKADALAHLMKAHSLQPSDVCFFFDDVLDFSIANICGLRIMIGRNSSPLLHDFAIRNNLVDYLTANNGANGGIREAVELLTGLSSRFDDTIRHRADFTDTYQAYLKARNKAETKLFISENGQLKPAKNLE